jgi:hypothetical protein
MVHFPIVEISLSCYHAICMQHEVYRIYCFYLSDFFLDIFDDLLDTRGIPNCSSE